MDKNLTSETLLVVEEKEQGKPVVKAATRELEKNGVPKTGPTRDKTNPNFLQIDRHDSTLENYFSNFMRQCKTPTQFSFFKVPVNSVAEMATVIGDIVKNGYESGKELLDKYRVNPKITYKSKTRSKKKKNRINRPKKLKQHKPTRERSQRPLPKMRWTWTAWVKLGPAKKC